jgi:hypothetical protein
MRSNHRNTGRSAVSLSILQTNTIRQINRHHFSTQKPTKKAFYGPETIVRLIGDTSIQEKDFGIIQVDRIKNKKSRGDEM